MDFDSHFNYFPIVAGVLFGSFFLIIFLCVVCRLCAGRNISQNRFPPTVIGPSTVSDINSQFNHSLPAPAPYHTFATAPYPPPAPVVNYPPDPLHQYPVNQSYPIHHQPNSYDGQFRAATSPPMPQSDAPPSYSEVIGNS